MKNIVFILICFGCFFMSTAQQQPEVGDELTIQKPYNQAFNHIKFPKLNILTKRGKVANYKSVYGNAVVIEAVTTKTDGVIEVILKKKDGSKFFGYLSKVKANYTKALETKEMAVVSNR